ncbi:hypothetical protein AUJ66_05070 [Candidatus Desantisbacteria bacterium CG1_02_38_46]|uniref:NADH:ubiquinone oxidoreductase 30kDa subunit domain-containing protein n=2 Tax=unclassified Candidatus Desantisiibacteriota TaxID=3106372 RepID=A0A1J4SFL6_9BACT|nr:MAG: hypothetical protein AUJ66_05070 [Candidatus Desantisbacteria bacterium CG1_02_38_46]PIU50754.1 MAG: hypothetical protein COS91_08025 [Candidatus Desantisbacteria bacterium CG07_land_8_20_14_0_80_39_15]
MEDIIQKIKDGLGNKIKKWEEKNPRRIYITIAKEDTKESARFLFEDCKARFVISTGIDTPVGFEILHHFSFDSLGKIVSLKVIVPKSNPEIESITPIILGAEFIEREIYEMLGVKFLNHPKLERLLLSDDWPKDICPLRKDVTLGGEIKKSD